MLKEEYLKFVLKNTKLFEDKRWYVTLFSELLPNTSNDFSKYEEYFLCANEKSICYLKNIENELKLTPFLNHDTLKPLFRPDEKISIDSSWLENVTEPIITTVGRLLLNKFLFEDVFKNRIPYVNKFFNSSDIESLLIEKIQSKNNNITVKEMIEVADRVYFLTNIAEVINISATPKNITRPTGIDEKRKELFKEYENRLNDPVATVELEKKLMNFDEEYLKDDPSAKVILAKKSKLSRKKMFLMFGKDKTFRDNSTSEPILQSLEEGTQVTDEKLPEYINSLRFGSFARGSLTALSGTQTKVMLRSLGSLVIENKDCGTKKGIVRYIDKSSVSKLIGREIKHNGKWLPIDNLNEAKAFQDKMVEMRTALYCLSSKNNICYHCTLQTFKEQPNAIFNLSTEVTSKLTTMFMKLMHGDITTSTTLELKDIFT